MYPPLWAGVFFSCEYVNVYTTPYAHVGIRVYMHLFVNARTRVYMHVHLHISLAFLQLDICAQSLESSPLNSLPHPVFSWKVIIVCTRVEA